MDLDHRQLYQICLRSLDRHVDRGALAGFAHRTVSGAQLGDRAAPAQRRLDVPLRPRVRLRALDVASHALVTAEVGLDELRGFVPRDAELALETKVADAVEDGEVRRLCPAPLLGGH